MLLFIEDEGGILLIPLLGLRELFGIDRDRAEKIAEGIAELHEERRREARG